MHNSNTGRKRKALDENVQIIASSHNYIQPFKEMPSFNHSGEGETRISAHELFSFYTTDVIKQDIVYAR